MKSIEKYYNELDLKIDSCVGTTEYPQEELDEMKKYARIMIKMVMDLNHTKHQVILPVADDKGKVIYSPFERELTIEDLKIGHNDFQIIYKQDYVSSRILKNILNDWKDIEINDPKIISRFYSNGWSTALSIPYHYEKTFVNKLGKEIAQKAINDTVNQN